MLIAIIILNILTILWGIQVARDWPKTNAEIMRLHTHSRDFSLVDRTAIKAKIQKSQTNFDALLGFAMLIVFLNICFGFYKLLMWGIS